MLGVGLAVALVRTDIPARGSLAVLVVAPLVLPGVLQTIAWIFLAAPTSGLLSGIPGVPSVFGLGGMVLVEGLRLAPIAFLLVAAALRAGDPALEEAALVAGVGRAALLRRVTLPLLRPALLAAGALLVLRALGTFEVPTLLGAPERTWVFTTRVWLNLGSSDGGVAEAAAASVPLLACTLVGATLAAWGMRGAGRRQVVSGRAHRAHRLALGRWRLPVLAGVVGYVVVAVALPLGALVWMSTQPYLTPVSNAALGRASTDAYRALVEDEGVRGAVRNSLAYGTAAGVLACALAVLVCWTSLRSGGRRRAPVALDAVAFLTLAVPGLVLGVGFLAVALRGGAVLYGTAALLVLGYVARYLPYATRIAGPGLARVGSDLDDVARVSGVGWWQTLGRVVLPLAAASFAAAWIAVLSVALTDVSLSLVLYTPSTEVLGVRIWALYESGRWDELAALGVITTVVVAALGLVGLGAARSATGGRRARG